MKIKTIILLTLFTTVPIFPHITINLPEPAITKIGNAIWYNEGARKVSTLVYWKDGEGWLSLGIGHFIWYPQRITNIYKQTFGKLILFLQKNKVVLPPWLIKAAKIGAPWQTREIFLAAREHNDERIAQLQAILESTIALQAQFIINQFKKQINKLLAAHSAYNALVKQLSQTPEGLFAMIDYSNCKGYGSNAQEQYHGQGWGLLQVLQHMHHDDSDKPLLDKFIDAAVFVLENRVKNAPPERHEQRWLPGWKNRINRYKNPWP